VGSRIFALVIAAPAVLIAACGGRSAQGLDTGADGGASGADAGPPDPCAGKCDALPKPELACAGGKATPRCNERGTDKVCRWQIDCVPRDPKAPADPNDYRAVQECTKSQCGAEPSWDPDLCVHGLSSKPPSCFALVPDPCGWYKRCLPKPCSNDEGTCNLFDRSALGGTCGDNGASCPFGYTCATMHINDNPEEDISPARCIRGNSPCDALKCASGRACIVLESYPAQVHCQRP
jgi:hypothetical protein